MTVWAYGVRTPKIDESAWVFPSADVIGKVTIGPNVYIGAGAVIRGDYGTIIIGEGSAIEENVTIHARMNEKCVIGKNVTVGHAAMLHNCTINDNAVIGMNSTISDYAIIGEWAIIAEGAVVKSKAQISPNIIAAGVPAVEIGPVNENHKQFWSLAKEVYQQLAHDYLKKLKKVA
jgi:carbonic anhydrase/acetyltransferase-like protein (isoleucine patch superfamily)